MYHLILSETDWMQTAAACGLTPTPIPQSKVVRVDNDIFVWYERIVDYVANDPELQRHQQTILYGDWPNHPEILAWVAESPPDEVSAWARAIERAAAEAMLQ